jgi:hypothetical protein
VNILLFAGAGASVELGVPAMRSMVIRLGEHYAERRLSPELLGKLAELVKDPKYDMESLIEELDHMTSAGEAFTQWGAGSSTAPVEELRVFRQEAEWFVNHMCERVEAERASLMWGPTLSALPGHEVVIATTNYDRAVEIAGNRVDVPLFDGFADFAHDEWTTWRGFESTSGTVLLKVHGSTDWYHVAEGDDVVKLRHPMALFGRVTMQVDTPHPLRLRSAAILPSREKKINLPPYPDLAYEFRKAIDKAEVAMFVGTSLRDPDMRGLYKKAAQRIPTFLVGPGAIRLGEKDVPIHQTASKFLAATLPTALRSANPIEFLISEATAQVPDAGILDNLVTATNAAGIIRNRCDAIERLADASVALPAETIRSLLQDSNSEIRTFALALIGGCGTPDTLLEEARLISLNGEDTQFSEEVALLEKSFQPTAAAGS